MGVVTGRPGLPLWSDYTDFLRRHRALIGAVVAAGVLVGLAWSTQQPRTFSATASVALAPVPVYVMTSADQLVPPEVSIDTDAQLLRSGPVLGAIGDALGTDPDRAAEHLSVTASANTHVLHVTVTAGSAERAAAAANAAVAALADVRRQTLGALRTDQVRYLQMQVEDHDGELEPQDDEHLVSPDDEQFDQLFGAAGILDELREARRAPADVISPADPPRRADYANAEVALTSGAMLGLLVGCLAGAARDRVRRLEGLPGTTPTHRLPATRPAVVTTHHEDDHHAV